MQERVGPTPGDDGKGSDERQCMRNPCAAAIRALRVFPAMRAPMAVVPVPLSMTMLQLCPPSAVSDAK